MAIEWIEEPKSDLHPYRFETKPALLILTRRIEEDEVESDPDNVDKLGPWFVSSEPVGIVEHPMESRVVEDAKKEALQFISGYCRKRMEYYGNIIEMIGTVFIRTT
jgi:hypothetical protein